MALVAILEPDLQARARLTAALGPTHELRICSDWTSLWDLVQRFPVQACVLDLDTTPSASNSRELHRLRRQHPDVGVVLYGHYAGREEELFELGRHGADRLVLTRTPVRPGRIARAVDEALAAALAARVARRLEGSLPAPAVGLLTWCIEHAEERPGVEALAEAHASSARGLARRLRSHDLPTPSRLLLWGRLFRAIQLLGDEDTTVERVAYRLGYSSGPALRRALRKETGHPPTEIQRRGGISCMVDAFLQSRPGRKVQRREPPGLDSDSEEASG